MGLDFPNIDPVALAIGPLQIRWYALAYLAGFLIGWRYALYLAGFDKRRPDRMDVDDFIPWVIAGVILGGRLGYVLFYHFEYYMAHPLDILKVWQGGMAFHGGAAGVILALIVYPPLKGFARLPLADIACASVPIGLFFGRLANFINGELYGRPAELPWAVKFPGGGGVPRHPSQLYEAALEGLVLFIILFALYRIRSVRARPGLVSAFFLLGYAAFRSFVEIYREPDEHIGYLFGHVSMGQILSLPMVLFGLGLIIYAFTRKKTETLSEDG